MCRRAALTIAAALAAACLGCVHLVREADLLPGARPLAVAPARPPDLEVEADDGSVLRGYSFTGASRPVVVVYFGGNGEIVTPTSRLGQLAGRHGFDVFAVNYRGYGPSSGAASLEAIEADALRVFDAIVARPAMRDRPVVVYGLSLGTTAALKIATSRPVAGVILEGTPTAAAEVVPTMRRALPWYLRPFVRLRAAPEVAAFKPQPIDLASSLTAPLLAIHGTNDTIVAVRFGRAVFEAAGSTDKTWCAVDGAGHNDLWADGRETPHTCLASFVERVTGLGRTP